MSALEPRDGVPLPQPAGPRIGLGASLAAFVRALRLVLADRAVRAWYLKALVRTVAVALVVVAVLIGIGSWGLWAWIGSAWGAAASVAWALVVLYVSGTITAAVSGSLVQMLAGERALLASLEGVAPARSRPDAGKRPSYWRHRRRELVGIAASVAISLTCWPLLLFPLTIPIGVVLFAWALGQENFKAADRILYEHGQESSLTIGARARFAARVGLGLGPAMLAVFPIVGWMALPLLQAAAVLAVRGAGGQLPAKSP